LNLPLEQAVSALRAAGEPSRLRILALLAKGELAVGELAQALGQSQPRVSRHMKLLTECGLAERAPEGAWVFYRISPPGSPGRAMVEALVAALSPADEALQKDAARLEEVRAARHEMAAAYFSKNAADWNELGKLHLPEAEIEAAVLAAAGPGPFGLMVDVGAGQGRMLQLFADRVERAEGFDTSRQMLAIARANLADPRLSLRLGDAYDPPSKPGQADLVTIHQVLHFLADPGRAVMQAARLLKPGGLLVIADFAPHDLEYLRTNFAHRRLGFSDEEIAQWCAAAGAPLKDVKTLKAPKAQKGALTVKVWRAERPLAGEKAA
jgi:ArsR family transcriptional regulator